jgi:hypothetical protein
MGGPEEWLPRFAGVPAGGQKPAYSDANPILFHKYSKQI